MRPIEPVLTSKKVMVVMDWIHTPRGDGPRSLGALGHAAKVTQLAAAMAMALALSGCASVSTEPPPRPASAVELRASLTITPWWIAFNDRLLTERIELALLRNEDLGIAAARLREVQAQLAETNGARGPSVSLVADSSRGRTSTEQGGQGQPMTLHRNGLVASYEIDFWGRLASASDAARSRIAAQAWARSAIAWGLSAQVAELHVGLAALQTQIDISEAVVRGRRAALALREQELRAGAGTELDLRRAEAELSAAEFTWRGLQRQQLGAATALAVLLGERQLPSPTPALSLSGEHALSLPIGDLQALLAKRPDVQQAEQLLGASAAEIKAAQAGLMPSMQISGRLGSDVRQLSQLLNAPGFAWSMASSFAQTLFDGGRLEARVDQARARDDAQKLRYQQVLRLAAAEAYEALSALDLQQSALLAGRDRTRATARAQELARLARQTGAIGQLELLDAERTHFSAQLEEVDALRRRLVGQVAVFKALGPAAVDGQGG